MRFSTVPSENPRGAVSLLHSTAKPFHTLTALCLRLFQECPSGVVNEDTFKDIYSQFFPQGGTLPRIKSLQVCEPFPTAPVETSVLGFLFSETTILGNFKIVLVFSEISHQV